MSIHEVSAEQLAELFHHYHQALAPDFDASKQEAHAWADVPAQERSRMVSAARLALLELGSTVRGKKDLRQYYAKPGEAEWGC